VKPRRKLAVLADEPDNRILECAVTGGAHVVVTGDKAMLALKNFRKVRLLSLSTYLDEAI
jgi:predicted nucleic acid-binding protein